MGNGATVANSSFYDQESEDICGYLWSYGVDGQSEATQCWVTACAGTNRLELHAPESPPNSSGSLTLNEIVDVQAASDPDTPFLLYVHNNNGSTICLQADSRREWQRWLFKLPRLATSSHMAHHQEEQHQIQTLPPQLLADVLITSCAMDRPREAALILAEVRPAMLVAIFWLATAHAYATLHFTEWRGPSDYCRLHRQHCNHGSGTDGCGGIP
jgi:hypothetical protein